MGLLVGSLVGLLVGKSYHTRQNSIQKDGYSLPTNSPTNNRINWIWMSKKIGLKTTEENKILTTDSKEASYKYSHEVKA